MPRRSRLRFFGKFAAFFMSLVAANELVDILRISITKEREKTSMVYISEKDLGNAEHLRISLPMRGKTRKRMGMVGNKERAYTANDVEDFWLDYSPPTKANQVRFPLVSPPDFRMWESCRGSPVPPHSGAAPYTHLASPSSAPKTSMLRAAQISSLTLLLTCPIVRSPSCSLAHSSYIRSLVRSFVRSFTRSFVRPLVLSFTHSFVQSFFRSFTRSHLFVPVLIRVVGLCKTHKYHWNLVVLCGDRLAPPEVLSGDRTWVGFVVAVVNSPCCRISGGISFYPKEGRVLSCINAPVVSWGPILEFSFPIGRTKPPYLIEATLLQQAQLDIGKWCNT
ncbi:hypothetical protein PR048_002461 [Dryococelus australis]|uniref:Uncharacterized protein n=1 Tax=Dryococelus australis TaxID=614101 RepID=A0ABQ9ILQ9_9NEOP|nr:hypothetical protein PR048_002461 [Dryococelus australis]